MTVSVGGVHHAGGHRRIAPLELQVAQAERDAQDDDANHGATQMSLESAQQERPLKLLANASGNDCDNPEQGRFHGASGRKLLEGVGRHVVQGWGQTHQEQHHQAHDEKRGRHQEYAQSDFSQRRAGPQPEIAHPLPVGEGQDHHQANEYNRVSHR